MQRLTFYKILTFTAQKTLLKQISMEHTIFATYEHRTAIRLLLPLYRLWHPRFITAHPVVLYYNCIRKTESS